MYLSDIALKRIGFEKKGEGETVEAQFYGLHIYRLLGFNVDDGFCETFSDQIDGVELNYGLGFDLDKICNCLLGDVLTNNTPEWEKEKGITPPYLAILVGPTEFHVGEDCHFQEKDDMFLKDFFSPPKRVSTSAHALFQLRNEYMKNLKDRFVWCSLCVWEGMSDDDIIAFKEVKKVRDEIGHGKLPSPSNEQVNAARNLARKVLLQQFA